MWSGYATWTSISTRVRCMVSIMSKVTVNKLISSVRVMFFERCFGIVSSLFPLHTSHAAASSHESESDVWLIESSATSHQNDALVESDAHLKACHSSRSAFGALVLGAGKGERSPTALKHFLKCLKHIMEVDEMALDGPSVYRAVSVYFPVTFSSSTSPELNATAMDVARLLEDLLCHPHVPRIHTLRFFAGRLASKLKNALRDGCKCLRRILIDIASDPHKGLVDAEAIWDGFEQRPRTCGVKHLLCMSSSNCCLYVL